MDKYKIFMLFVYKQFKVLLFYWKTVALTFIACFGLQYLLLYFAYAPSQPLSVNYSPESPEILVIYPFKAVFVKINNIFPKLKAQWLLFQC